MFVNQRAMFELALSENSVVAVSDKRDARYLSYAYACVSVPSSSKLRIER
jgi:hypothetical protein